MAMVSTRRRVGVEDQRRCALAGDTRAVDLDPIGIGLDGRVPRDFEADRRLVTAVADGDVQARLDDGPQVHPLRDRGDAAVVDAEMDLGLVSREIS
jgi:hypothetical protein